MDVFLVVFFSADHCEGNSCVAVLLCSIVSYCKYAFLLLFFLGRFSCFFFHCLGKVVFYDCVPKKLCVIFFNSQGPVVQN